MAVNKTGKWWIGDQPNDIREFLEAHASDGYEVHEFRLSKCECGSERFLLWADDDEGCAKRQCVICNRQHFICDSSDYWEDAKPVQWACVECEMESNAYNVGTGFSLYEDGDIRWLYIGVRCPVCGVLGCFAGWKIAYSPSRQLLDQT
jgi:hypothetical protein